MSLPWRLLGLFDDYRSHPPQPIYGHHLAFNHGFMELQATEASRNSRQSDPSKSPPSYECPSRIWKHPTVEPKGLNSPQNSGTIRVVLESRMVTLSPPLCCSGAIDFAGSGVVHMFGGSIGLALAKLVGVRPGRFFAGGETAEAPTENKMLTNVTGVTTLNERDFQPKDPTTMTLGCMLLWFGW